MFDRTLLHARFCRVLGLPEDTSQIVVAQAIGISQPRYAHILAGRVTLETLSVYFRRLGDKTTAAQLSSFVERKQHLENAASNRVQEAVASWVDDLMRAS